MAIAKSVGKDRRGNIVYVRDEDGSEITRQDLYEDYKTGTVIDFKPTIEPGGRVVDDDLPHIASLFHDYRAGSTK